MRAEVTRQFPSARLNSPNYNLTGTGVRGRGTGAGAAPGRPDDGEAV
jgi:hypothetical protein